MASFSPEGDSFDDLFEDSGEADAFSQLAAHFQLPAEISQSHLPEVFPLPCLAFPHEPVSTSARVRKRFVNKRKLCRIVNGLIKFLNFLYKGSRADSHTAAFVHSLPFHQWHGAQKTVLRSLVVRARHFLEDRRAASEMELPTGGHRAVAALVKQARLDSSGYAAVAALRTQVPSQANAIVEPSDDGVVDMLSALPPREASFYQSEANCISWAGKSVVLMEELESQYAFVGGAMAEYINYFARSDLPRGMWTWLPFSEVRAVSGFAVVMKKDNITQRKLLMSCSFNYLLSDPRDPTTMVSPCYNRLPMGCSHSVHILMSINMQSIGMTLRSSLKLGSPNVCGEGTLEEAQSSQSSVGNPVENPQPDTYLVGGLSDPVDEAEPDIFYGCSDDVWWERFQQGSGGCQEAGYSVDEWWKAIRQARDSDRRTIVVMNFFAGERRSGDIQSYVESLCIARQVPILMISVDLAVDDRWDLGNVRTFHEILQMLDGYVDIILRVPPCSTVSRARHNRRRSGPRPLRFRWCVWGRPDLTRSEEGERG